MLEGIMKPRSIALLVLACVTAVILQVGVGVWLIQLHPQPVRQKAVFAVADPQNVQFDFGVMPDMLPVEEAPVDPVEIRNLAADPLPVKDLVLSAPVAHENLTVFFIEGKETMKGRRLMPLETALAQGLATVHEGITVENHGDVPLFIQAGDIIKGGSQDRTLPYDMIIPVASRRVPLPAFCVEAGRSGPRAGEISTSFQASTEQLPGKQLHLAARVNRNQAQVWAGVQAMQTKLTQAVGAPVQSGLSPTSMQLSLENPAMRERILGTLTKLNPLPEGEKTIGAVFVINGVVQGAEIYGSHATFREMYGKLLRANAIAALAERRAAQQDVSADAVRRFLDQAEVGANPQHRRGGSALTRQLDSHGAVLFETFDPDGSTVMHRSYLAK